MPRSSWSPLALAPSGKRAEAAALARARITAEWTWANFRARKSVPALTQLARKERFVDGARNAAKAKRAGTLDKIVTAIGRLSLGGRTPTQAQVASVVGKDLRTVKRYWREASTGVETGDISLAIDKKEVPFPAAGERSGRSPMPRAGFKSSFYVSFHGDSGGL